MANSSHPRRRHIVEPVRWLILTAIGLLSAASLWLFNRWLENQQKA